MKESLLTILRDKNTKGEIFRKTTKKLASIIAAEAAMRVKQKKISVRTSFASSSGFKKSQNIVLVPILRSGISLLEPFLYYFSDAKIGFLGIKRDEKTFIPHLYYENLPSFKKEDLVLILDPMIATGGSLNLAIKSLKNRNANEKNIVVFAFIASFEGIKNIKKNYKKVSIEVIAVDKKLSSSKCIVPGLGDFGDRFF
jgi:uracil phosphoribosyltransferase